MKEKMNMADEKPAESSDESDADSPMNKNGGSAPNFHPRETIIQSNSELSGGGSTGCKSSEELRRSNDLPEDKEIQSSSEDEQ